jgi:hypothetical protein
MCVYINSVLTIKVLWMPLLLFADEGTETNGNQDNKFTDTQRAHYNACILNY